ncbi:tyrosine--tRNA ligase [Fibrobacterota bacterium]
MTFKEQFDIIKRGAVEIVTEEDLLEKLKLEHPLKIKLGVDPTSPDVHLGFTVVMRKLKAFQDLGHRVVLIIGDYTATVGDPSGKNKTRPLLTHAEVLENSLTYQQQFFKIVDKARTQVVYNGAWFKEIPFTTVTRLMSEITVAQMLEREDFQNRHKEGHPISLHEFLYPMMQAYDSVVIRADVELGGTDQKFNILRGRELQRSFGQQPQAGIFMPILIGTDGKEKMSKSLGNTIGISEVPQSMYHKLFNLSDSLIEDYLTLLTEMPIEEINQKIRGIAAGDTDPNTVKDELARSVVGQYHGRQAAEEASRNERRIHLGEAVPDDLPEVPMERGDHWVPALMMSAGLVKSNGEGRRLVQNGGVQFDGKKVTDPKANVSVTGEHVLKAGKRKFVRIKAL